MLLSTIYVENGVEKKYDHVEFVRKLKESHYSDLKALIRKAMGPRKQVEFARDIGMSKEYLNRILKEGSDLLPSNKMLASIELHSYDESVTLKELMICAGRTPASERVDDWLRYKTTPATVALEDSSRMSDVYTFKKNMIEALIKERDKKTPLEPKEYVKRLMSEFISNVRYTAFDFECFYNESEYESLDDWTLDCGEYTRNRNEASVVVKCYATAAVRKHFGPDEWVRTKVDFAIFFEHDEDGTLTIIDTDWDIPQPALDEPSYEKLDIENTYSLKEFLDEENETPYTEAGETTPENN